MDILVGCEFSGRVRDAFNALGHNAVSCDLVQTEAPGPHMMNDVRNVLDWGWDLAIFFPECRYLCSSGIHWNRHIEGRSTKTQEALDFVRTLLDASIPKIALENPRGMIGTRIRKSDQEIHPYMFGDDAKKATCLWLKNLPKLILNEHWVSPRIVNGMERWGNQTDSGQNRLGETKGRASERSKTYPGIARAMAEQWGK